MGVDGVVTQVVRSQHQRRFRSRVQRPIDRVLLIRAAHRAAAPVRTRDRHIHGDFVVRLVVIEVRHTAADDKAWSGLKA